MDDGGGGFFLAERAVAQPEVQRDPGHDHQVGLGERHRAGPADQQRVTAGQHAAGLAVRDHREPQALRAGPRGHVRAAQPDVGAEHKNGAARRREQLGDPGHVRGVGLRRHVQGAVGDVDDPLAEDRLEREVAEHRAPVRGRREQERLVDRRGDRRGGVLGPGPLGDRREQRHVVHLLERAPAPLVVGRPAAEHHEGRAVEPRRRHGAHAVGDARPRGDHGEPGGAGEPAGGLRREYRRLLVPHVDEAQRRIGLDRAVVQRENVPAGQGEHGRHAVPLRDGDGVRSRVPRKRCHPGNVTRGVPGLWRGAGSRRDAPRPPGGARAGPRGARTRSV